MQLLTVLLALWPYLFFAGCAVVFSLDGNSSTPFILFAIVYTVLSGILHHQYRKYATTLDIPLQSTGKCNLLVKLIPAFCDMVLYGALTVRYIKTMIHIANGAMMCVPVHLIYFVILIPYYLSRLFSLVTTMRVNMYLLEELGLKLKFSIPWGRIWLHTVLHLLPLAHIISNIIVYRKLRSIPTDHT